MPVPSFLVIYMKSWMISPRQRNAFNIEVSWYCRASSTWLPDSAAWSETIPYSISDAKVSWPIAKQVCCNNGEGLCSWLSIDADIILWLLWCSVPEAHFTCTHFPIGCAFIPHHHHQLALNATYIIMVWWQRIDISFFGVQFFRSIYYYPVQLNFRWSDPKRCQAPLNILTFTQLQNLLKIASSAHITEELSRNSWKTGDWAAHASCEEFRFQPRLAVLTVFARTTTAPQPPAPLGPGPILPYMYLKAFKASALLSSGICKLYHDPTWSLKQPAQTYSQI